jgi:hypothetical protein
MRLYNRYLVTLALLFTGSTVLMAAYGQEQFSIYFSVYLIEYLAVTLIFSSLRPKAKQFLNVGGIVLFAGFLGVAGMKIVTLLTDLGYLA